jgi:hypothetical protein
MNLIKEIRLYDADSLEYSGSMIVNGNSWQYEGVKDEHLIQVTTGLPLKAAMSCMITFNLVYDVIESEPENV